MHPSATAHKVEEAISIAQGLTQTTEEDNSSEASLQLQLEIWKSTKHNWEDRDEIITIVGVP